VSQSPASSVQILFKSSSHGEPYTGLSHVRKWSAKKILQGQGKIREFYFESRKIDISLNTIEGWKKDLGSLLSQRYFFLMKKKNVLKIITLNERRSRN